MSSIVRYHPGGYIAAAAQQNRAELYDGLAATFTAWDTSGVQTAQRALTAAEVTQLASQDTAAATDTNRSGLQQALTAALGVNRTWLAIASPTAAQTTAQTQRNTRQIDALIMLILSKLDDTAGT